jgi:hypothetical protein
VFLIIKYLLALKLLVLSSLRFFEICVQAIPHFICVIISVYWSIERPSLFVLLLVFIGQLNVKIFQSVRNDRL